MAVVEHLIKCPKCKAVLGADMFNLAEFQPCPSCESRLQIEVFPALFREVAAPKAESVMTEGTASCFYHAEKKAAVICDSCGRFLCALCDVDFDGQHICPACLQSGAQKGKIQNLRTGHTRHENLALLLALLPMLIFLFPTLVTAPITLFYSIKHWNAPAGIVPRRRRLIFTSAIILASLQIIGWVIFFVLQFIE